MDDMCVWKPIKNEVSKYTTSCPDKNELIDLGDDYWIVGAICPTCGRDVLLDDEYDKGDE